MDEALEMMYRHAHTIGRTASLMECPALAQLAHGMEGTLADVLEGFARLDPPTLILLRQTLGTMQALLDHLYTAGSGANGSPPHSMGRKPSGPGWSSRRRSRRQTLDVRLVTERGDAGQRKRPGPPMGGGDPRGGPDLAR